MLIVVEGPDKAGKTTLVKQMQDQLEQTGSVEVLHCGPIQRHPLDEYVRPVDQALARADHVICDRLHIGEQIYGPLLRGESRMSTAVENWIDLYLQSKGALLVWMDTSKSVLYQRLKSEGDELLDDDFDMLGRVFDEYLRHRLARASVNGALSWLRSSAFAVGGLLDAQNWQWTSRLLPHRSYVGAAYPEVLFVGDERSTMARDRGLPQAFAPYPWSSGAFLMEALSPLMVDHTIGLVNGNDDPDLEHLMFCVEGDVEDVAIVALGTEASATLSDHEITHVIVPHPQWVKRFHSGSGALYAEVLRSATSDYVSTSPGDFKQLIKDRRC